MKLFKSFANCLVLGIATGQYVADTDGTCTLLTATCDHEGIIINFISFVKIIILVGFHVVFDKTCQETDYRAVQWNELYANGWTQSTSTATFGSAATAPAECLFSVDPTDATKYKMDFNFRQCGTDYPDSDSSNLVYRNVIQAQEYYNDIILGAKVCTLLFKLHFVTVTYA